MTLVTRLEVNMDDTAGNHAWRQALKDAGRMLHDALDAMRVMHRCPRGKMALLAEATRGLHRACRVASERCEAETATRVAQTEADARADSVDRQKEIRAATLARRQRLKERCRGASEHAKSRVAQHETDCPSSSTRDTISLGSHDVQPRSRCVAAPKQWERGRALPSGRRRRRRRHRHRRRRKYKTNKDPMRSAAADFDTARAAYKESQSADGATRRYNVGGAVERRAVNITPSPCVGSTTTNERRA